MREMRVIKNVYHFCSVGIIKFCMSKRTISQKQYHLAALCELKKARWAVESGEPHSVVFSSIQTAVEFTGKHNIKNLESSIFLMKAAANNHFGYVRKAIKELDDLLLTATDDTSSTDLSTALAHRAYHHGQFGDYTEALSVLGQAKHRFPPASAFCASKEWIHTLGLVLFEASFYKGEYENAKDILCCWSQNCSENRLMKLLCNTKKAQLLQKMGDTQNAHILLEPITNLNDPRSSFQLRRLQGLLLLADIHLESGNQTGALSAMSVLFTSISLAEKYGMILIHKTALLKFVLVLLHLNYPIPARQILQSVLPFILTNANLHDQGLAQYTNSLCCLSQSKLDEAKNALQDAIESIKI
jgi:tetratricopeptide (TPR) repeat protein